METGGALIKSLSYEL